MEWININDKLPEHRQMVLVSIPDDLLKQVNHVAEFNLSECSDNHIWQTINSSHQAYTLYANIEGVTHWCEILKPPKTP